MKIKKQNIKHILKVALIFLLLLNTNLSFGENISCKKTEIVKARYSLEGFLVVREGLSKLKAVDDFPNDINEFVDAFSKAKIPFNDLQFFAKFREVFVDVNGVVSGNVKAFFKDLKDTGFILSNHFGQYPKRVKAWEVFESSADNVLKALRTDVPTLARFTDDFGSNTVAFNQIKNSPDLLKTWQTNGAILHRNYAGSSSWPIIQVEDAFKVSVRNQFGDDIGDLVEAVDDLNISNNAAVGGGVYHPSLPSPSSNPITAVNFLSGEVADGTAQTFINALHPILKKRVDYLEFLKAHNLIDASQQSVTKAGKFGSHSEFRVMDKAIKDLETLDGLPTGSFPESRLDEFTVFVKAKQGTNPPRCVCCWHGTHGVKMIGNE